MVKGSCVCGDLSYEFTGEPVAYAACHCIPCRKTGGADRSLNLLIPNDNLKVTSGQIKQVSRKGDSGKDVYYNECSKCGNVMYVTADSMDTMKILKLGTIDDEEYLNKLGTPKRELYCKNMWAWEKKIDGAEHKETM